MRALVSLLAATLSTAALAAPKYLYGKSIVISWTEQRMQRRVGETQFHPATRYGEFSLYISTKGQLFSRAHMASRKRAGDTDRVGTRAHRAINFHDQTIIIVQQSKSGGARRIAVTVDKGLAGCTAVVIRGKEEGASVIVATSQINSGVKSEIKSVQTSGVSCAIKNGNVFGGG
jgi:hypothetical protein